MEWAGSCCWPKQRPSLRSILQSFIGLWVKLWHRNKTTGFESNLVQSSRSMSMTCPRKGHVLRFKLNSTATSDGSTQKLGNNVRLDSESISTKVCSPISSKWNATCLRKGRLLRFKLNSTATSDDSAQMLQMTVSKLQMTVRKLCLAWFWMDCNQRLQPNQWQMKCYVWKLCSAE